MNFPRELASATRAARPLLSTPHPPTRTPTPTPSPALPASLTGGHYWVKLFLVGGGLARIRNEAQVMGRLGDHPHIVAVHDIGEEDGPALHRLSAHGRRRPGGAATGGRKRHNACGKGDLFVVMELRDCELRA